MQVVPSEYPLQWKGKAELRPFNTKGPSSFSLPFSQSFQSNNCFHCLFTFDITQRQEKADKTKIRQIGNFRHLRRSKNRAFYSSYVLSVLSEKNLITTSNILGFLIFHSYMFVLSKIFSDNCTYHWSLQCIKQKWEPILNTRVSTLFQIFQSWIW